ncbi:MAG: hypothetical protein AAF624_02765 [Bacteroidota bacterium]
MRAALLLLRLGLAACATGDSPDAPAAHAAGAVEAETATPDEPQAPLRLRDLAAACESNAVTRAAAYPADPADPPRLLVLVRDSVGGTYTSSTSDLYFRTWGVYTSSDYPDTEVVACLTGFEGAFLRACEFESSRDDSTYVLDLYEAAYNVRLREAQTGTLLTEFGLDATSDRCPLFHTFTGNGERERRLVSPPMDDLKDELLARLAPDYDTRREFMNEDEIQRLDSMDAVVDSLRSLNP